MPKSHPKEFRRDVVEVARRGDAPIAHVARDFGISETRLHKWMRAANVEDGIRPGLTKKEAAELREIRKNNRILEQEDEILRRAAAFFARDISPK